MFERECYFFYRSVFWETYYLDHFGIFCCCCCCCCFLVVGEVYETCFSSLTFIGQFCKTADLGNFELQVFLLSKGLRVLVSHLNFHTEDFWKIFGGGGGIVDGDWEQAKGLNLVYILSKLVKVQIRWFDDLTLDKFDMLWPFFF